MALESRELQRSLINSEQGGGDARHIAWAENENVHLSHSKDGKKLVLKDDGSPGVTEEEFLEVDGKYGWIVVIASFLCCFMVGTMFIAFSILYLEFVDYFNAERGVTGWIGSLYLATGNICGEICFVYLG